MSVMAYRSEASGHHKQINGTTFFYSFPHDVETVLRKGLNAIHVLADIDQRSTSKLCDSDNAKLNAEVHECVPMECRKCVEDTDEGLKTNEGWMNPTKHAPMTCFCKNNNNSRKMKMLITIGMIFLQTKRKSMRNKKKTQ